MKGEKMEEFKNEVEGDVVNEEENKNDLEDEESVEKVSPSDIKLIRDTIKQMEEWNKSLYNTTLDVFRNRYGIGDDTFIKVGIIKKEDIDTFDLDKIAEILNSCKDEKYSENFNIPNNIEEARDMLKDIKDLQYSVYESTEDLVKTKKETDKLFDEYMNFIGSAEVVEVRKKRLESMKKVVEEEDDPIKKASMKKMIDAMESSASLDFLMDRFNRLGDDEIKSVMDGFFNEKKGSYVINRYKKRVDKFGYSEKLYHYFFNIEENFLPEKYHPFNNLFLYYYMRYVAYSNPYDKVEKLFVQSLTSSLGHLIYHKFSDKDTENKFLKVIEAVDDKFENYREYFYENNTTRPGHPVRVEYTLKREEERKTALISKMDELGITGYDKNATADKLQEYMSNEIKKLLDAQKKDEESDRDKEVNTDVTQNTDGTVDIKPVLTSSDNEVDTEESK